MMVGVYCNSQKSISVLPQVRQGTTVRGGEVFSSAWQKNRLGHPPPYFGIREKYVNKEPTHKYVTKRS